MHADAAEQLPHATRPLTDAHRALLRMLAQAWVMGQIGAKPNLDKIAQAVSRCDTGGRR